MLTRVEIVTPLLRAMVGRLLPSNLSAVAHVMPIIGRAFGTSAGTTATDLPTIDSKAPTVADDRQDGADHRQTWYTHQRSAIERFNEAHRKAGTGIVAEPVGRPRIRPSGPLAAAAFVRWVAATELAREWKVDDLWCLASEDFAPALNMVLPPRRVFLSALKKAPGVICTPNRRVYDRTGKLLGKTTFYQLPASPAVRTAAEISAMTVVKHAA